MAYMKKRLDRFALSLFYCFTARMHNATRRQIAIALWIAQILAVASAPGAPVPLREAAAAQSFSQIAAPRSQIAAPRALKGAPGIYEWHFVADRGPSPFDRIGLHRIASGPAAPTHPGIAMLYLPGTNMNGEVAIDDERYSMPLYLAAHGVDVWAMDYRTHFVPSDTPPARLAVMAGWTDRLFEGDIEAAAAFVRARTHSEKLFIAGFSRGASFAYLFAASHPERVAGLVILDDFIPRDRAAAMPAGRVADDIGGRHLTYDKRRALMEAVIRDPGGPAPLQQYKSAAENLEYVVYHADGVFGGHGGLANPQGGFSDPSVLARVLLRYDRWWPAIQDYANPFDPDVLARLKASKIPVIAFASTNISARWPAMVADSAAASGSTDITVERLSGWGHLDIICGTHAMSRVYAPLLAWLRRHQT
jgi:pimeloyl-ACP methyl ester carboxylesterase